MVLSLCVLPCLFFKDGRETSQFLTTKNSGFLCGLSSQVYPCHVGLLLSPLPIPFGKVITKEHEKFFNAHPQKRICVEVDISKYLKDSVKIQTGAQTFY